MTNALRALTTLLFIAALAGCSKRTTITLTNESKGTISNITIAGTGFHQSIETLPDGGSRSFELDLKGDSSVRLNYESGGRRIVSGDQGYLMANHRQTVQFRIRTNDAVALTIHRPMF